MNQTRHWKERWDPRAPLRFRKRLLIGAGYVNPGDPMTPELRALVGEKRIQNWWDSEFVELDVNTPAEPLLVPETGLPVVTSVDVRRALARRALRLKEVEGEGEIQVLTDGDE